MLALERQNEIMTYLKKNKSASVEDLSRVFFIGPATIRRDLEKLEKANLIKRTYGGAVLLEGLNAEIPIFVREKEQTLSKERIGKLASQFVNDGDIIIMDSSTTTYAMIPYLLPKNDLTIITNGLKTAETLGTTLHTKVHCTGGKLRENSLSLVGPGARDFIKNISAQKFFFSCRGVSAQNGSMDSSEEEAELRRIMMEHSEQTYLLYDSSKFQKNAFYKICDFSKIDYSITDTCPPEDIMKQLEANHVAAIY